MMIMKNIYKITFHVVTSIMIIMLISCEPYKDDRYDFSNTVKPYVLFSGNNEIYSYEGMDTIISIPMELPISVAENVVVKYQINGTAIFNQDYYMENTEETTIEFDVFSTNKDKGYINIYPLDDNLIDDYKTLEIKLVEAYTDSTLQYIDVGRNNVGATFEVYFYDDDCPSSYSGEYTSYTIEEKVEQFTNPVDSTEYDSTIYDTTFKDVTISLTDTNQYYISDITAGYFDILSPPNVPVSATAKFACGEFVIRDIINMYDILSFIDIKGDEITANKKFDLKWKYVDDLGYVYDEMTTYFEKK